MLYCHMDRDCLYIHTYYMHIIIVFVLSYVIYNIYKLGDMFFGHKKLPIIIDSPSDVCYVYILIYIMIDYIGTGL